MTRHNEFVFKSLLINGASPKEINISGQHVYWVGIPDNAVEWDKKFIDYVGDNIDCQEESIIRNYLRIRRRASRKIFEWTKSTHELVECLNALPNELKDEIQKYLMMFKMKEDGMSSQLIQIFTNIYKTQRLNEYLDTEIYKIEGLNKCLEVEQMIYSLRQRL